MVDTSETYIKMCEKAEEIQEQWKPAWGDNYYKPPNPDCPEHGQLGLCTTLKINYFGTKLSPTIWLPRQDQLQEMLYSDITDLAMTIWDGFAEFDGDGSIFTTPQWALKLTSMEQLWLAFVMKEKYNKIWDGETWVISN